jgi:uncharacterized membrane protein/DNA-directed RNA polymerase subunit RPC12/RpoP
MIELICKQCGGRMDIDDSQSVAFCSYCGTKHLIKKEVNVTNNYYGGPAGGTMFPSITKESIERAKNYQAYISAGAVLLFVGIIFAIMGFTVFAERHSWFGTSYTTPNVAFIFLGFTIVSIGIFLIIIGLNYRHIHETSNAESPNGPKASSFCMGCGNRVDPSSMYCKFCGTLQR